MYGKYVLYRFGVHIIFADFDGAKKRITDMRKHELKTWPVYFQEVYAGLKTFVVRFNDRNYQVGDLLELKEWDDIVQLYTHRSMLVKVTYIIDLDEITGGDNDYVVMSIEVLEK